MDSLPTTPLQLQPYFARKSNVFNQYFVKVLWFWITGAFAVLLYALSRRRTVSRRRIQATLRYALVTIVWIFTTQWFFGPAFIDRSFRLTGGQCQLVEVGAYSDEPVKELFTATACKVAGGSWAGGHDISGHTFILILGSVFLLLEAIPIVRRGLTVAEDHQKQDPNARQEGTAAIHKQDDETALIVSLSAVFAVVGMALFMLTMTFLYFHTWREKLTGFIVAVVGLGSVYVLPRYVSSLDAVIGRPGV